MGITTASFTTLVAGLQYYELDRLSDALQQGVRLLAQREPDNPYDRNAVSLWLEGEEARRWDLLHLVADPQPGRDRWQLGHLPRRVAAEVAPQLDAGLELDCYVAGGDKSGSWSLSVRCEGAAADGVLACRARSMALLDEADRLRAIAAGHAREVQEAVNDLARRFPGSGWDVVTVDSPRLRHRGTELQRLENERVTYHAKSRDTSAGWRWETELREARRAGPTAVFGPIVAAQVRAEQAKAAARAARRKARRDQARCDEVAHILADAAAKRYIPDFESVHLPFLPSHWLVRDQILALGLRPEHCRIVATSTTRYLGTRYHYLAELDPKRVAAAQEKARRSAPRASGQISTHTLSHGDVEVNCPW